MTAKVDLKVVLLGKEYGGKTSLVERFIHSRFNENVPYQNVRLIHIDYLFSCLEILSTCPVKGPCFLVFVGLSVAEI